MSGLPKAGAQSFPYGARTQKLLSKKPMSECGMKIPKFARPVDVFPLVECTKELYISQEWL